MPLFTTGQIDHLFNPKSVAVVGASENFGKWGFDLICAVLESSSGRIVYAVNPSVSNVVGLNSYASITQIPDEVDFAVVAVPRSYVLQVIRDCVQKGVKGAIIISGGFAETDKTGEKIQDEVVKIAKAGGLCFIGPNTMGHFSTASNFNTCPHAIGIHKGTVSLISQSGNIGAAFLQRGVIEGVGFSKFIGTGNEAYMHLEDFLEYLEHDETTKVITIYMEGLREGRRFFKLAKEITRKKPIVVLKAGRTVSGAKASLSHSSALAGSEAAYDAMFKQAGVIRVDESEELLNTAIALNRQPLPKGRKVGILTIGGGFGVVATDACHRLGLEIATLSPGTIQKLNSILPPIWSHGNPVDTIGETFVAYQCLFTVMEDENVDALLVISVVATMRAQPDFLKNIRSPERERIIKMLKEKEKEELEYIDNLIRRMNEYQKPVVFCSGSPFHSRRDSSPYRKLKNNGISVYETPEAAVKVLAHLVEYGGYLYS